jgi:hypothetical protein
MVPFCEQFLLPSAARSDWRLAESDPFDVGEEIVVVIRQPGEKVFETSLVYCANGVVTRPPIGPLGTRTTPQPSDNLVVGAYSAEHLHR